MLECQKDVTHLFMQPVLPQLMTGSLDQALFLGYHEHPNGLDEELAHLWTLHSHN